MNLPGPSFIRRPRTAYRASASEGPVATHASRDRSLPIRSTLNQSDDSVRHPPIKPEIKINAQKKRSGSTRDTRPNPKFQRIPDTVHTCMRFRYLTRQPLTKHHCPTPLTAVSLIYRTVQNPKLVLQHARQGTTPPNVTACAGRSNRQSQLGDDRVPRTRVFKLLLNNDALNGVD